MKTTIYIAQGEKYTTILCKSFNLVKVTSLFRRLRLKPNFLPIVVHTPSNRRIFEYTHCEQWEITCEKR